MSIDELRADYESAIAAQRAVIDALTENVARLDEQLTRERLQVMDLRMQRALCVCKQPASPAPEHEDTAGRMR